MQSLPQPTSARNSEAVGLCSDFAEKRGVREGFNFNFDIFSGTDEAGKVIYTYEFRC